MKGFRSFRSQGGFTLVEIAIVLVIIGLLLGGVLKGQDLINSAKVRSMNNNVSGITAAWFAFQDRFRALPGDYDQADAKLDAALTAGDGNGAVAAGEVSDVWQHLSATGLITGSYTDPAADPNDYSCPTSSCPDNGFGQGFLILNGDLAGTGTGNANELITGGSVPVEILAELDRKIDDGAADDGSMRIGADGTDWSNNANCTDAGGDYELLTPSDDCAAVLRNF